MTEFKAWWKQYQKVFKNQDMERTAQAAWNGGRILLESSLANAGRKNDFAQARLASAVRLLRIAECAATLGGNVSQAEDIRKFLAELESR